MKINDLTERIKELSPFEKTREIVSILSGVDFFEQIASKELELLKQRDDEDEYKLKEGIAEGVKKGLLNARTDIPDWIRIAIDGKLPMQIYNDIMEKVSFDKPGTVLVISGNSGVGKGTLVDVLLENTENAEKWSNGDIFRVFTYFVLDRELGSSLESPLEEALNGSVNEPLNEIASIDFTEISSRIIIQQDSDILINLPDKTVPLDEIKNGLLKETEINKALPSVARHTQGEVIAIVNEYLRQNHKKHLILEGRKETLNYINADYRVELVLEDMSILGKRRAAQKIVSLLEKNSDPDMEVSEFLEHEYR